VCGIAGILGPRAPSPETVAHTLRLMGRRGPDGTGTWQGTVGNNSLTLLHSRLAIIDLNARANQPLRAADCVLVTNGEIYNYRELRDELRASGHRFDTESDSEVIIRAYRQWGAGCLTRFEGMWAFALFDERNRRLWLSRDRFGEKPLYTMQSGGSLYFGSEVKFLAALAGEAPPVNERQVRRYLFNGYRALNKGNPPETFFRGVHEFPAASSAMIREPGAPEAQRYWALVPAPQRMPRADAVEGARERLLRATELAMRADVPVSFCLSGGVDSGALVSLAVRRLNCGVHTFSIIDSDERYDERENIATVTSALGCRHTAIETSRKGFLERLERQVAYHDSPVATISYYVHDFLSEAIRAEGYKVAISGTAADEIFTGYYNHYAYWLAGRANDPEWPALVAEWRDGYGAAVRNPLLKDPLYFANNPGDRDHLYSDAARFSSLTVDGPIEPPSEERYADELLRNRMLNELFHESVPVFLHEDDLNSMSHSVENRSPFLNSALVEFMFTVPSEHLVHRGYAKSVLRDAVAGILPEPVRANREKKGFNASILSLVDTRDSSARESLLAEGSPIFDYVARDKFAALLDDGDFRDNAGSKFLFSVVSAKAFLESDLARGHVPAAA
jgi:asparagine synthase (glutamine-hydrolysing)